MQTNHNPYIIKADGGGTSCRAAVCTTLGSILAQAEGGPKNIATDFETALGTITKTTTKAWIKAGLEIDTIPLAIAVLGLAGVNLGDMAQRIKARLPFEKSYVTDDRETNLRGALAETDGCLAAIGSGSFFCSQFIRVSRSIRGWGFAAGDDGSGARLGQDLLRLVLHCNDGLAPHSDLTRVVLLEFGDTAAQLATFSQQASPGDLGHYALKVISAAEAG